VIAVEYGFIVVEFSVIVVECGLIAVEFLLNNVSNICVTAVSIHVNVAEFRVLVFYFD